MTDIETIREALAAYEELAVDLMNTVCPSMGNDVIRAQNALRLFDEMMKAEPVARKAYADCRDKIRERADIGKGG